MPAKPLSEDQKRDARRLKEAFKMWQSSRQDRGLKFTQDEVAEELFGFGQSALSQYLNGRIPLNVEVLAKFAAVMGVAPENISPSLTAQHARLARAMNLPGNEPAGRRAWQTVGSVAVPCKIYRFDPHVRNRISSKFT